jgi:hypothetical protein
MRCISPSSPQRAYPQVPENYRVCASQKHAYHFPSFLLARLSPLLFRFVSKLRMKLKGLRFETVLDIQRESQEVQESIRETHFRDAFEGWKKMMEFLYTFPRRIF